MNLINKVDGQFDCIATAKKTAEIVSLGLENENYSDISRKLDELSDLKKGKEEYVFEGYGKGSCILPLIICIILTVGYLYYAVIAIGILIYSKEHSLYGVFGVVLVAVIMLTNVFCVIRSINELRFLNRYSLYQEVLKHKSIEVIVDLAEYTKIPENRVIIDLNKAIKKKLIPQGHFGKDNMFFIVSDEIYRMYMQKKATYDRYYRKIIEERGRMLERTEEMQRIMDSGKKYIYKINECNEIIGDKNISQKLVRMEKTVSMIFHEVDINPKQADKLGLFMNYYLPTTEKLLEAYIDIDSKKERTKSLLKTKKDIERVLDTINESFEHILDKFYQEQELDIASDISALEIMMKQEH